VLPPLDRDEISNLYREPSIDASYQGSVQLAEQGRRILEIDQSETRIACSSHVCPDTLTNMAATSHFCF
jgi:uncharacterized metal-binding protein